MNNLITAKYVNRVLTNKQKEYRCEVCHTMKEHLLTDPEFLSKLIMLPNLVVMITTSKQSNSQTIVHFQKNLSRKKN